MSVKRRHNGRAAFLDRDGTLIVDRGFIRAPDEVELVAGAADGARALAEAGFSLVIVSNQSGIGRGVFDEAQADAVHARVVSKLRERGVEIAASYRCPHAPAADGAPTCSCRKPLPGMLLQAAQEHGFDLRRSWMIGDRPRDAAAGRAAGCRTAIVDGAPPPSDSERFEGDEPDVRAHDLAGAARQILAAVRA